MNLFLVPAADADRAWLDKLRRDAYRDLFDATWGAWDEARHIRHFEASIDQGNISIIRVDGRPVGMLQLHEHQDAVEVGEIQIRPEAQNQGIGTAVLNDIVGSARAQGRAVRLSTGVKNERALRLYLRLGFRIAQTSDTHVHMLLAGA